MSEDDARPHAEVELFAEMMNGLVGKTAEAVILVQSGDPSLAAAMGGAAGGATKGAITGGWRLWSRRKEKIAAAAAAAREESGGLGLDELLERALDQDDERRLDLFLRSFREASQAVQDEYVRFCGRVAASGVLEQDDAKVDEKARVFDAIAGLDAADLKVLLFVTRPDVPARWIYERNKETPATADDVLPERLPELASVIDSVVSRLEMAGLLTSRDPGGGFSSGGTEYRVTSFARLCVGELLRGASIPPAGS